MNKELSVYPIDSYPALLHKDTTSWNEDDRDYIHADNSISLSQHSFSIMHCEADTLRDTRKEVLAAEDPHTALATVWQSMADLIHQPQLQGASILLMPLLQLDVSVIPSMAS